jgi:acetyl-CoA acetyltransferase family protein
MADAYLVSAVRTPIGIGKPESGALWPYQPVDLAAAVLSEAALRAGAPMDAVEDVILGCVTPIGDQGGNIARLAALQAGFPPATPAVSLNRMCGSGQQAVHFAAQAILAGDMDLVLAGGIEMMSHQPLGKDYPAEWPRDLPYRLVHQGLSAEMIAERWRLSREALDDFACESHRRAGEAIETATFGTQTLTLRLPQPDGQTREIVDDQGVRRPPDRTRMAELKPVFKPDGVVTAGNSSQISDGAAALLVASERALREHNLTPLARIIARVVIGSDPVLMLDGPIPATRKVLERAGLRLDEIDLFEVNEAFACVPLAWLQEYPVDPLKLNPFGGAIAHGHPLGATGAILMTKLVHALQRTSGRYGLQTMCIGHGMATATVLERL